MARQNWREGETAVFSLSFYRNEVLFDPYSVASVKIYDAPIGGNLITSLTPYQTAVGIWTVSWAIPVGIATGHYYDEWTWQATALSNIQVEREIVTIVGGPRTDYPQVKKQRGPLFVGHREVSFFNHIGKELIQNIISQKIIYYSVSEEHTKSHDLYDEAINKTVFTPVEVNALVLYKPPTQSNNQFSIDTIYSIEVYFHIHELQERNLIPREGDFVKFGTIVYEIQKLTRPQITYGQMNNEVMVKAECMVSRKSQFEVLDNIPGDSRND